MTSLIPASAAATLRHDSMEEAFAACCVQLRIITSIEPGHGVVPVFGDGGVLLRPGEVAIYREERPHDLVPGLYCLERQRPVAGSPLPDTPREISREVVYVRTWSGRGEVSTDNAWEYVSLHSRIVNGVRRYARAEGPLYWWALGTILLGPVVGIYAPTSFAGEC